jgi:peptidoglycan/xylan/chitin deacetylase (PgdA/CDA1 family)/GT2 family glycosyltransferase
MPLLKLSSLPRRIVSRLVGKMRVHWINLRRRYLSLSIWKGKRRLRRLLHGPDDAPLLSVIIPAHNAAGTLAETLQSLMAQRIRAWEAIVVDDGSTDSTPAVVADWQARDPRIRCVRQAQGGVSQARNTGLLHARAERVMFLDADDWIAADCFDHMFGAFAENPRADVVYCGYVRISDDGWELPMSFNWEVASAPFETFGHHCAVAVHSVILHRQVVVQAGGFDTSLKTCEDWDLWLRIARTGASFVGVPLPLAYYRMRPGSATSNYGHMISNARQVIDYSRAADPRVKRSDPRYVDGLRDGAVIERWTYFAIWCAACEAANGRPGVPALDLLGQIPDMRDNADGISDCLFHGLSIGGRRPPWALTDIWRTAEPHLVAICERLEATSSRPGLTRSIMENLETQVVRADELASPQTLWRMHGQRVDIRGPVPDIEPTPHVDNLYLRVTDGNVWLDEIYYPLLGPISSRDLARLILETWGFDNCLGGSPAAMRRRLMREAAADVGGRITKLFRMKRGRKRQLIDIGHAIWRGLRAGGFLSAASTPPSPSIHAPAYRERAAIFIERQLDEIRSRGDASDPAVAVNGHRALPPELATESSADRRARWNRTFATPDPWNYTSPYEQKKYDRTLALLPDEPIERALELACAEGHFTQRLASRVRSLIAADISETALERARLRCADHANVRFQCLDLIEDAIPERMNLIVCSEVLYFLKDTDELRQVADRLVSALAPGGRLMTTHAFVLSDDRHATGFDWANPFGAKTIDRVISETPGLHRERSLITDLYRIDVYRRATDSKPAVAPDIRQVPLDSPLEPEVERQIVWGGAIVRRSDAQRDEVTEQVPILMYHRVSESGAPELARYRVDPRVFEQQLQFLRQQGYHAITASELLEAMRSGEPLRGRPIMLSFDDAYRDFFDSAWPLLQRYDFKAQVFVVTEKVAGCADWDSNYGESAPLMAWDEIETLNAKGIAFGSHLASHRAADCLSTEELLREGAASRFELETRLRSEIRSIAFPFGIHSHRVINTLKMCGYELGVTTNDGVASIRMDSMMLPRVEVMGSDDLAAFAWKIGRHDAFERSAS